MSGAAYIDKRGREPGSGLTPDKKEARTGLGSGSDASAALATLGVVASNFFKVVLRKRRYSRCKCTDPRRLKALARGTQELLATAPHI